MSRQNIKIKKVRAYPIPAVLMTGSGPKQMEIVKLTNRGLLAETDQMVLKVADEYQMLFELPVLKSNINTRGKVVKVYDQYRGTKSAATYASQVNEVAAVLDKKGAIYRMAEFHFLDLDSVMEQKILHFVMQLSRK